MKIKKVWLGLAALVLAAALMLGLYLGMRPGTETGGKEFTVLVVHKNGEEKLFSNPRTNMCPTLLNTVSRSHQSEVRGPPSSGRLPVVLVGASH